MLKISDAVKEILESSDTELEAMRSGVLNLSAYAAEIQNTVEKKTFKKVQKTTIVVALSRLQPKVGKLAPLKPAVHLNQLSVKSSLADITFEKNEHTFKQSRSLSAFLSKSEPQFLTITQGINEITVIVSEDQAELVLRHFHIKPKALYRELVGLTVTFSEKYLSEPNVIYAILASLAGKRVNIIEIVSTLTELSVIIHQTQLEASIHILNEKFI